VNDARLADRLALTAPQKEQTAALLGSLDLSSRSDKVAELEKQVMVRFTDKLKWKGAEGDKLMLARINQLIDEKD